jgi:cell division protein FtsA
LPGDGLIVGLDIGTTSVYAVIAEYNENGILEIIGVGRSPSVGLRRGVVINIESTLKSVEAAVEKAELMSGREVEKVFSGIAGAHIEGINSRGVVAVTGKGREITQADVDRVLEAAKAIVVPMDREVLHVIPQEYIVDAQGGIKTPIDMIGVRLEAEVHIITGSVTSAQNLVKCINRAGFKVENLILLSLAASKAVLTNEEKELGVLLIDLGGGTTDFIVHLDGSPYFTDVLSVGGTQVTGDISIVLKTPMESAEKIKREAGCCYMPFVQDEESVILPGVGGRPPLSVARKEICSIIQPRVAEIFTMIKEKIEKKGYMQHLGGGIVLTGGGALLQGTIDLAQEIFGVPARIGFPAIAGGLIDDEQGPLFASAVGLVQFGADEMEAGGIESKVTERSTRGLHKFRRWLKNFFE